MRDLSRSHVLLFALLFLALFAALFAAVVQVHRRDTMRHRIATYPAPAQLPAPAN
jgi:hypothetical protein